ncbi:MAG: carbonic anhydrase [Candidatus Anstonellales archaeon]
MNAEEAIEKLKEGNRRFVSGQRAGYNFAERRKEVLGGQKPFVTIVTCSDSRVVPEFIFDANIGELFVVRTAGNILDDVSLGSVEYGTGHLKTPLLLILGHEKCGAVTATCSGGKAHGKIKDIVKKIKPACKKASGEVEKAIEINLDGVEAYILKKSKMIKHLVEEGELKIKKAKYLLGSGEVIFL